MKADPSNVILRLNAKTFPMSTLEKEILAGIKPRIIEIEGNTDDEILAHAHEADAVMIVSAYLRAPVIRQLERCRIISRMGTGTDKIDVDEATRHGIVVTNVPDFSTDEVADHTMSLLLASARQLKHFEAKMRAGKQPHDITDMHRLSSQTIGIIGFGRIGKAVARRAKGFGMKVLAYDPQLTKETADSEGVSAKSLSTVLEESDYVCLLCPLMPITREMIKLAELKKMKSSAVLINTGRGELVREADLVTALKEGIIRYAALDVFGSINVFTPGGFPTTHPFFSLPNVMLTPHVSAYSEEAMIDVTKRASQAVVDILSGKSPKNPINKPEKRS